MSSRADELLTIALARIVELEIAERERLCNPCDYCACTEICDDANAYKEFIGEVMIQRGGMENG